MCSSHNAVQLEVEAEWEIMMFTHHSAALSTEDALRTHTWTHTVIHTGRYAVLCTHMHALGRSHAHTPPTQAHKCWCMTLFCLLMAFNGDHYTWTAFDGVLQRAGFRCQRQLWVHRSPSPFSPGLIHPNPSFQASLQNASTMKPQPHPWPGHGLTIYTHYRLP